MAEQLDSFVNKFRSLWQAGNNARLSIECHAGQARVHLQLDLPPPPPPPPQQQRPRRSGPSRFRRRARRAEARATVAKAVTPTAEIAVQTDDVHQDPVIAEQAGHNSAEQAGHNLAEQAQPQPWLPPTQVRDQFCPDHVYHPAGQAAPPPHHHASPGIPQLDGSMFDNTHEQASLNVTSYGEWSCKCCMYETFFDTEDMLKHHHDENHDFIEYEECNLCYTGHVWDSRS